MNVLGITDGVVSGAAIIQDGVVLAAVNEERLIRQKMALGFPKAAIDTVLQVSGLKPVDIQQIAVATLDEHFRSPAVGWNGWFQSDRGPLKELQLRAASWGAAWAGRSPLAHSLYYWMRTPSAHR